MLRHYFTLPSPVWYTIRASFATAPPVAKVAGKTPLGKDKGKDKGKGKIDEPSPPPVLSQSANAAYLTFKSKIDNRTHCASADIFKLIGGCETVDDLNFSKTLMKRLVGEGVKLKPPVSTLWIRKCVALQASDQAISTVTDKLHFGIFPHKNAYHFLMRHLLFKKNYSGLWQLFCSMTMERSDNLTPETYGYCLSACTRDGSLPMHNQAVQVYRSMVQDKIPVCRSSYLQLIQSCVKQGQLKLGAQIAADLQAAFPGYDFLPRELAQSLTPAPKLSTAGVEKS